MSTIDDFAKSYVQRIRIASRDQRIKELQQIVQEIDKLRYEASNEVISDSDKLKIFEQIKTEYSRSHFNDAFGWTTYSASNDNVEKLINTIIEKLKGR